MICALPSRSDLLWQCYTYIIRRDPHPFALITVLRYVAPLSVPQSATESQTGYLFIYELGAFEARLTTKGTGTREARRGRPVQRDQPEPVGEQASQSISESISEVRQSMCRLQNAYAFTMVSS